MDAAGWSTTAICLVGVAAFVSGFVVACLMWAAFCNNDDKEVEKRGVWIIKDRAYKLARIPAVGQ